MTEIGLSELEATIVQGSFTAGIGDPLFDRGNVGVDVTPREELVGHVNVCQRRKYYPNQSAKTLLKGSFELSFPTILNPGHMASLSVNQVVHLARAVGLKMTLPSYGLMEDLFVRS